MCTIRSLLTEFLARFERFDPADGDAISSLYAPDASFIDPSGITVGRANIVAHFTEQYARFADNRCEYLWSTVDGKDAAVVWRLELRQKSGDVQTIEGMTHLHFGGGGIERHRDYYGSFSR